MTTSTHLSGNVVRQSLTRRERVRVHPRRCRAACQGERYYYSPYGEVEVVAETYFGDYNGDGLVDSDDASNLTTNGTCCGMLDHTSGDCWVFDFDMDGDLIGIGDSHLME